MKRAFDILASALGLALLAPAMLVIALWVRLDSPGPALFRQERVGRHGRTFRIHKFRTMIVNAPSLGPSLTTTDDARITRSGRFLRRHKLDELPQLLDVLVGDMSIVGPRPEVPQYVALYPQATRDLVLSVRPGLTDEAAIRFRDENKFLVAGVDPHLTYVNEILPLKLALYEQYVRDRTLRGDVAIIWRTLVRVIRP